MLITRASAVMAAALAAATLASSAVAAPDLRVRGNQLVDGPGRGQIVQLRGVNRAGLEYQCIQGYGFFESRHPFRLDTHAMVAAMARWDINIVRVPLNEDCWLGIGTKPGLGGNAYRRIVKRYVRELNAAHLYVLLDLHWAAPPGSKALGEIPMADDGLAPRFWRSLAQTFKHNHTLIFDLFNEPFQIGWRCWRDGCQVPAGSAGGTSWPSYRAAGMQQLVNAVRSVGARQPLLLGGINYAFDDSRWGTFAPKDPMRRLVVSDHTYGGGLSPCDASCRGSLVALHQRHPVVFGELGEVDCAHSYTDRFTQFADSHAMGYLAWAWDAGSGWTCRGGPSLITDYKGDPTRFGVGYRDHLLALGVPRRA